MSREVVERHVYSWLDPYEPVVDTQGRTWHPTGIEWNEAGHWRWLGAEGGQPMVVGKHAQTAAWSNWPDTKSVVLWSHDWAFETPLVVGKHAQTAAWSNWPDTKSVVLWSHGWAFETPPDCTPQFLRATIEYHIGDGAFDVLTEPLGPAGSEVDHGPR